MVPSRNKWPRGTTAVASLLVLGVLVASTRTTSVVSGFQTSRSLRRSPLSTINHKTVSHQFDKHQQHIKYRWEESQRCRNHEGSSTSLNSFMGSDGGLFGIGTPELVRQFASVSQVLIALSMIAHLASDLVAAYTEVTIQLFFSHLLLLFLNLNWPI